VITSVLGADPSRALGAWLRWANASGLPMGDEAERLGDTFLPELAHYCELISGPTGAPIGLMTRGEDETFTRRAAALMHAWEMPEAVAGFLAQAAFFAHKRAFLKLEWAPRPGGGVERLAAYYHRRRPAVATMRERYAAAGVVAPVTERVGLFAETLGKSSIHFVAAAMRPAQPPHHKLYFSQYVTAETIASVGRRVAAVMDLVGIDPLATAARLDLHARLLPPAGEHTIFVSMKFTDDGLLPGMKIDYPLVTPDRLALVAPPAERAALVATARALCAAAGTSALSFLGVTLVPGAPPAFKLYADLPPPEAVGLAGGPGAPRLLS
jgi:hypothetical protein